MIGRIGETPIATVKVWMKEEYFVVFLYSKYTYLEGYFRHVFLCDRRDTMNTKKITTIGILCAMAVVINVLIHFPMVPAVSFLSYDPKDIIIVIGGFIYGPMISLLMSGITSVLELMYRGGTILDVVMNMVSTCAFACTAAFIYKKMHNKKGALIGLVAGVISMTVMMVIWNYIVTPIYYGMPREAVVAMMLPGIIPFNLLKSGLNAGITLLLYKPIVGALRYTNLVEKKDNNGKSNTGFIILGLFIIATAFFVVLALQGII